MHHLSPAACAFFRRVSIDTAVRTCGIIIVASLLSCTAGSEEWLSGIEWPEPPVVDPGPAGGPPSDATVLFNGKDLSAWEGGEQWIVEDGVAISSGGSIRTKESFGDCQVHLEWSAPTPIEGHGQERGNSGVYMMERYEVQILDSHNNPTYFDGQAGAIYKQSPPMANVMRPPGKWNTFDILFTAPRFNGDGSVQSPAYVTLLQNGVVLHHHFRLEGGTFWHQPPAYERHAERQPIALQFHHDPVRFRNIWVREIQPVVGRQVRAPAPPATGPNRDEGRAPPA